MAFSLSETKRIARQAVHGLASIAVLYNDATLIAPVTVTARYHNKLSRPMDGGFEGDGYAQIIESIDRLIFSETNLTEADVELRQGGTVTFEDYNIVFVLDVLEPPNGPENVYWTVVRE